MNKTMQLPAFTRAAITLNSYDEANKTIEVVFATETQVRRRSYDGTRYIEILSCKPDSVRLERINSGANLVDSHNTWSIKSILGVVERAWIEGSECKATIRLSEREEVAGYVQDIKTGITRNISVGYNIHETEITEDSDNNTITVRVTDWEPAELSILSVPADHNSGTRSKDQNDFKYHEVQISKNRNMTPEEIAAQEAATRAATPPAATPPAATPPAVDQQATRNEAMLAERTRISDINEAVRAQNIDDPEFTAGMIQRGITLDQARSEILNKLVELQGSTTRTAHVGTMGDSEGMKTRQALEEVLMHRHNPTIALVSDKAKELRHASLLDMAIISLNARGEKVSSGSLSRDELVKRAMSTTDYPILLGNTVNRSLRQAYESANPQWRKFARKRSASDFKAISSVGVGGDFKLKKLTEGGEYKEAKMQETGDQFKLDTYGRKISITRHAIINDDLGAFMRYTELFGRGAAEMQAEEVYGLFTQNSGAGRKLADGKNLFATEHKNMAATGSALSQDSLTAARLSMRRQLGLAKEKIIVNPKFLVVPPELETLAWRLINANTTATNTDEANPFKGAFDVIVDAYMEDPDAWYLFADPATIPVVEYAFLNGEEGLYTDQKVDFDTDNLEIKVRSDFAATIEEFRGVYKNAGE